LIPACKNFLGELLVFWLARRALWKSFHAVRFRAAEPLPQSPGQLKIPIIFYANHNTWWDGYLAHIVTRQVYGLDGYLMMDVQQLRRFWFFTWAGVFSVDQQNGRSALRSIEYIAKELRGGPGRALWIYPQGEIRPQERRPLGFHSGLARVIRRVGECYVYPVAVRFEYFREQYPDILIDVGPACYFSAEASFEPKKLTVELEASLTDQLDRLRETANALQLDDFVTIIKGKGSTDTFVASLTQLFRRKKP
jgi:chlorobactene lauroyltransferase